MAIVAAAAVALGLAAPAWALDKGLEDCRIETWSNRDGLPGAWVRAIVQGPDGDLFVGTYGGVARYDGARMQRLQPGPPLDVMAMAVAPGGPVVVATNRTLLCARRGGLDPCDIGQGPGVEARLPGNPRIQALSADHAGTIWIGTDGGVFSFRPGRAVAHAPAPPAGFGGVTAVHRDRAGGLWLGGERGLVVEVGGVHMPIAGPSGPITTAVQALAEGTGQRLWAVTEDALVRIDDLTGTRAVTVFPRPTATRGPRARVIEDRDGNVWIASAGTTRFRDGVFVTFGSAHGLPTDAATAVFEDREGSLWVGTRSAGIAQVSDRTLATNLGPPSLREHPVEAVMEDREGVLWFGSSRGLTRWQGGRETRFTEAHGLPDNRVYALAEGGPGELFIGTESGLVRMQGGRIEPRVLSPGRIMTLEREADGTLWIGTEEELRRRRGDSEQPIRASGFVPRQVRGIKRDPTGVVWVSTRSGLARVRGDVLERALPRGGPVAGGDQGLQRDADGTIWFGQGRGLGRLEAGAARAFGAAHGIGPDWLCQALADDHGGLWLASMNTIRRVDRRQLDEVAAGRRERVTAISFDTTDRRQEPSAQRSRSHGAWKARDGRLWFATLRGVITIDPGRVRTNPYAPTVFIERAFVDGHEIAPEARVRSFPPGRGRLEFHFAAVSLLEPHATGARYLLEGFDQRWIEAGPRRVAHYTNVPPGRYRFRVQASNADGVTSEAGSALAFAIRPRFHQTWWFWAALVLVLGSGVFVAHRTRLLRLRERYVAVFAERSRVARELHDRLLQGMSAVGLELSNVRRKLRTAPDEAERRLEATERAVSESLEETRRYVLELRDQASTPVELALALGRMAKRLCAQRGVPCTATVAGDAVPLSRKVHGDLYAIAQEAISNALTHAAPAHIELRLDYEPAAVRLTVRDDGRGFDPAVAPGADSGHLGLQGIDERARLLGGSFDLDTEPGRGTRIEIRVPHATEGPAHA